MESKNYFKENLKMLRKEEGLSQDKLVLLLETSRSTISFWENGEREPTMSSLIKLSKFFKVSIDYLVGLEK